MADAIQFTVPDDDFIELADAGASGSVLHQGGADGDSTIILVEAAVKPTLAETTNRFKLAPASLYLRSGELETYFDATTIWAVSAKGDQLLSVTPSA
jgi:hypothetical protein